MDRKIVVYGKEACPFTKKAREVYVRRGYTVEYIDVMENEASLENMLVYSKGERVVPVIVEGDSVSIGFGGT
ncbi:MAG: glutathione S-transferase N-terminal domain-containing protein [Gemmatimonadota bacterium]|nr:MAG: glutathione S-transferase N-terminal domain-containing protein [Gemmatimonadota bacterium]